MSSNTGAIIASAGTIVTTGAALAGQVWRQARKFDKMLTLLQQLPRRQSEDRRRFIRLERHLGLPPWHSTDHYITLRHDERSERYDEESV